jgi:hypothetical protein
MKTTTKNTSIKVNTGVKAGGFAGPNHNRNGLKVRTDLKAGKMIQLANHNRNGLKVRTDLKAGKMIQLANHNRRLLSVS